MRWSGGVGDPGADPERRNHAGADGGVPSPSPTPPPTAPSATGTPSERSTATASSSAPPPAATAAAPPSRGTVNQTVEPKPVPSSKPVQLDKPASSSPGIKVRLTSIRRITVTEGLPGEVAGPALAITVSVDNQSNKTVGLGDAVVNLTDSSGAPANPIVSPPARPLPTAVRSGQVVNGVCAFTVATSRQKTVTVTVSLAPDQPVLVFKGKRT